MGTGRLEAFSDGVIAVIITIMVLDLKIPHEPTLAALGPQWPLFVTYVLSFINVGIYWNNHHHLLAAADRIDGRSMWANLHLLFWLSLIPFTTGWTGESRFAPVPTAFFAFNLLMCGISYTLLTFALIAANGPASPIATAIGRDWKGKASIAGYVISLPVAFVVPKLAAIIFVAVALMWFVPDRRIERVTTTEA